MPPAAPSRSESRAEPFRLTPPDADERPALVRPRLLRSLSGRFDRALTVLRAGPGFGKTTLLRQALEHDALGPPGLDFWLTCTAADADAEHLLTGILQSVGGGGAPRVAAVVDAVRQRSPLPVAFVFDDVHLVPAGSGGAAVLSELLETLGDRAHLVLAGRERAPLPIARLRSQGSVVEIDEADLAFDADEFSRFAKDRGIDPATTTRWPALLEVHAAAGRDAVEAYLWEEVLSGLGEDQREALARVAYLDTLDDALIADLVGPGWDTARLLSGLPLTAREGDRGRLHALWRPFVSRLPGAADPVHRVLAARALRARGRLLEALEHARAVGASDEEEACLRQLALHDHEALTTDELRSVVDRLAESSEADPSRLLLRARLRLRTDVADARDLFETARAGFESAGDAEAEAAVLRTLGRIAVWAADPSSLGELLRHGKRLLEGGYEQAEALLAQGAATAALVRGECAEVLRLVDRARAVGGGDESINGLLAGLAALHAGEPERTLEEARRIQMESVPPAVAGSLEAMVFSARWLLGLVDGSEMDANAEFSSDTVESDHNVTLFHAMVALFHAMHGNAAAAERHVRRVEEAGDLGLGERARAPLAYARAALAVDAGDEAAAAAILAERVAAGMLRPPIDLYRHRVLALVYVLVPEARPAIEALELGPVHDSARSLGRAVVAARSGSLDAAAELDWSNTRRWRAQLPEALFVELRVAAQAGRPNADPAGWGADAHRIVRRIVERQDGPLVDAARAWLKDVAAPPPAPVELVTFGGIELLRGGRPIEEEAWRRERVRSLLQLLVARRRLRREEAAVALWPDKPGDASAANLRVNLGHLLRVLEPERASGEPSWFVHQDGEWIELLGHVETDADRFARACDAGDRASAQGLPSQALRHYERAAELYAGDYLAGAPEATWVEPDRTRLRMRFVRAVTRAGELHLGGGDPDRALELAIRAQRAEPLDEAARRLEVEAHLARRDRSAARRAFERTLDELAVAGLAPDDATAVLARRLGDEAGDVEAGGQRAGGETRLDRSSLR